MQQPFSLLQYSYNYYNEKKKKEEKKTNGKLCSFINIWEIKEKQQHPLLLLLQCSHWFSLTGVSTRGSTTVDKPLESKPIFN